MCTSTTDDNLTAETKDTAHLKDNIAESEALSGKSLKMQLSEAQNEIVQLREELSTLKERRQKSERQLQTAQAEIKRQCEENAELKLRLFCTRNLSAGNSVSFYTGFPNLKTFQATLEYYFKPRKKNSKNICYWRSVEKKLDANHYNEGNQQRDTNKLGRKRTLKPEEEFFWVMCRLRQGFLERHSIFVWYLTANSQ